jgi:Big-like domain-containing protein
MAGAEAGSSNMNKEWNITILLLSLVLVVILTTCDGCGLGPFLVSIAITPTDPSIAKGMTQQFTATGTNDVGGSFDLTTSVIWSSSDTTKATISAGGLATGVDVGSVTITASHDATNSGHVTGSTTLTITE